jgi:hypothetical protein
MLIAFIYSVLRLLLTITATLLLSIGAPALGALGAHVTRYSQY